MRNLYFLLIVTIVTIILFVAITFLFFEKEKHQSFFFAKEIRGVREAGYIRVDRYKTEDRIIYKSTSFEPGEPNRKITHNKFVFDRKSFKMVRFIKECKNFGTTTEAVYIEKETDETLGFLARLGSKFSLASNVAPARGVSLFDTESIMTYMPFVDKYNFARGGAQSFNAVYHPLSLLPPARGKVIFTSIRDEYINVAGKKRKTECLVVRGKGLAESYIWVSKIDRNVVQAEIKSKGLLIKKIAVPPKIPMYDYAVKNKSYDSRDIIFPSEDIALAGTIAIPREEGKLPSVLLVTGEGPYDRDAAGLYTGISHELAEGGYVVLRFDRRGIGKSQGDDMAVSLTSELKDIESGMNFLANHEKVNRNKIFIVAHGDACSYLPLLDFSGPPAKGLIMLGVVKPSLFLDFECEYVRDKISALTEIDKKYEGILGSLKGETLNFVENTKKEYAFVRGKRVFLERMRQFLALKPLEKFKTLDIPLIILHGKKDKFSSRPYVKNIERVLKEAGFQQLSIEYYGGLGHFFGEIVDEKNRVKYYSVNKKVLATIKGWINDRCRDIDLGN